MIIKSWQLKQKINSILSISEIIGNLPSKFLTVGCRGRYRNVYCLEYVFLFETMFDEHFKRVNK